jgi:arylformamidase
MPPSTEPSPGVLGPEPSATEIALGDLDSRQRQIVDRAYDNAAVFPDVPEWRLTWQRRSEKVALLPPARLDLAYGAAPSQKLDVFPHADPRAATAVFVHGGYWSRHSKETFRFLVRGIHAAGLHAVFIGHTLAPDARMDRIVAEVRSAVDWTFRHLGDFCFAARPLIIVGWSSGAQLAAMTMGEPYVAGGIGISGVYDIEPMRHGSINDVLKLDKDEARRNSPALHLPASAGPFVVAYGQRELPAFRRQSEEFHRAWAAAGLAGPLLALPGHHHHSVLDELYEPDGKLAQALAHLAQGEAGISV